MVYGIGGGLRAAELSYMTRVFVAAMATSRHQLGKKGDLIDMEFIWRDAHHRRTVFGMHVPNSEYVLAARGEEFVIRFVPIGHCSERWTWERGQRVKKEAIEIQKEGINA